MLLTPLLSSCQVNELRGLDFNVDFLIPSSNLIVVPKKLSSDKKIV